MSYIFDIIRIPFGWLIQKMFSWTGSYVFAVVLFGIVVKLLLFPFSIKQQKNSQKQAKLRPKENIIRKKYAGREDKATKMKLNTEIQELYQKENFSMLSGCLPLLISMLVLLAVYAVIRSPISYISSLPEISYGSTAEEVKQSVAIMVFEDKMNGQNKYPEFEIKDFVTSMNKNVSEMDDAAKDEYTKTFYENIQKGSYNLYCEITSTEFIRLYRNDFIELAPLKSSGLVTSEIAEKVADSLPDLELGENTGFNLGYVPSLGSITDSEVKLGEKLLLILPILTLISSYFGQALTRKYTYQSEVAQEQQGQMKIMNMFMPLFSLFISFQIPAAVSVYWLVQNVLGPVQQIALSKMFPIPEITEEELREAERLYGGKQKKKKQEQKSGAKRKSLVYDDDDEYESVTTTKETKVLTDKKNEDASIIEKAPLKDNQNK